MRTMKILLVICIAFGLAFGAVPSFAQGWYEDEWYEAEEASANAAYDYHGTVDRGGEEVSAGARYIPEYSGTALDAVMVECAAARDAYGAAGSGSAGPESADDACTGGVGIPGDGGGEDGGGIGDWR